MSVDQAPVEVLPGQLSIEDSDTVAAVHYGVVNEFDALPEGYVKVIQPMQPYSDAEEWALNKSMELYGFLGAVVRDQYGRILNGNQRQRIARLRGLTVPHTITHVRDDAHAIEIARTLNTIRRHYTPEQRQELALLMRDQDFSYRAIAEALGVGKSTVYRDVFGELRIRPESVEEPAGVPHGTPDPVMTADDAGTCEPPVPHGTPNPVNTEPPISSETPGQVPRVRGLDKQSYPAQRPTERRAPTPKPFDVQGIETKLKELYMEWLRHCEDASALAKADDFLETLRTLAEGRAKVLQHAE